MDSQQSTCRPCPSQTPHYQQVTPFLQTQKCRMTIFFEKTFLSEKKPSINIDYCIENGDEQFTVIK